MRAAGFWIGAIVGMTLTAAAVTVYFLRISRRAAQSVTATPFQKAT